MGDFEVAKAKDIRFNDNESLQKKLDDGSLGGGDTIQYEILPIPSAELLGKIFQFIGDTGTYTKGAFYVCVSKDGKYIWDKIDSNSAWIGTKAKFKAYDKTLLKDGQQVYITDDYPEKNLINDESISDESTWSAKKINDSLGEKADKRYFAYGQTWATGVDNAEMIIDGGDSESFTPILQANHSNSNKHVLGIVQDSFRVAEYDKDNKFIAQKELATMDNLGGLTFGQTDDGKWGYKPMGADTVIPFKKWDITPDLLWTNPNPSAYFYNGQRANFPTDTKAYTHYIIRFRYSVSSTGERYIVVPFGVNGGCTAIINNAWYTRCVETISNKNYIEFYHGYALGGGTNESVLIPYKVYGVDLNIELS